MADDVIDALIQEVAVKHGVALGRDDPLLILPTILRRVADDSAAAHKELLEHHKEELEMVSVRWGADAKEKAERILTAALAAAKDAMNAAMQEGAKTAASALRSELDSARSGFAQELLATRRVAIYSIGAACLMSTITVLSVAVWLIWR